MKKTLLLFFLFTGFCIYSEVIVLKNQEVVRGSILASDLDSVTIKDTIKEIRINKADIEKIYYDDKKYDEEKAKEEPVKTSDQALSDKYYENYKLFLKYGTGFIIPGLILTILPLPVGTPPIAWAVENRVTNYIGFQIGLGWYVALLTLGFSFDLTGIIFFALSGGMYKKWQDSHNVSFSAGYENSKVCLAVKYRF